MCLTRLGWPVADPVLLSDVLEDIFGRPDWAAGENSSLLPVETAKEGRP